MSFIDVSQTGNDTEHHCDQVARFAFRGLVAPRTQSQRSQRSASFGRRCPQYGHGILSPVVGSGWAAGASVYSTFILTESHKPHRIRQANRIQKEATRPTRLEQICRAFVSDAALASRSVTSALSVVACAFFFWLDILRASFWGWTRIIMRNW